MGSESGYWSLPPLPAAQAGRYVVILIVGGLS